MNLLPKAGAYWYNTESITMERRTQVMDIYQELELQDCPYCGGAGLLEEENGWCWYVTCMDCGSQTGEFAYNGPEDRADAARKAAHVWNIGKVIRSDLGE